VRERQIIERVWQKESEKLLNSLIKLNLKYIYYRRKAMTIMPRQQIFSEGVFAVPAVWRVQIPNDLIDLKDVILDQFMSVETIKDEANLVFVKDDCLASEAYRIVVSLSKITITYGDYRGAVWALSTVIALSRNGVIRQQTIVDHPDFPFRGYLLDISRDKLPSLSTLKELIDKLMLVKINHLQLYVEGFVLKLPSFPDLPYDDPLTLPEFLDLQEYAKKRGIDLAPNINTFGHMTKWLALERYRDLAESPEGFFLEGYPFPPSTLNPLDERSQTLAKAICMDLLSVSKSPFFNLNGDEPFELGTGKSKTACQNESRGKIYLRHMRPLIEAVKQKARPMIFGDVIRNEPEAITGLPDGTVVIDWGYDRDYDFSLLSQKLQGKHDFILAPGTSSWNSFIGRFKDMKSSIDNARTNALNYGAIGMLLTDWGDFSHPQPLVVSYPAIAYFANTAWSGATNMSTALFEADSLLFDEQEDFADIVTQMAGYGDIEPMYLHNRTIAFASWMYVDKDKDHPLGFKHAIWSEALRRLSIGEDRAQRILDLSERSLARLTGASLEAREIRQAIRLVKAGVLLNRIVAGESRHVNEAKAILENVDKEYARLWLSRNRSCGLESSQYTVELLRSFLDNYY
jgi:hexosaminidase